MEATILKKEISFEEILHGDHHIIATGKLAASLTNLKAGMVLKETAAQSGIYTPVTSTDTTSGIAVLLEDVEDSGKTDGTPIVIHGVVKRTKLLNATGSAVPATVIAALRANGIYAIA